MSRNPIAKALRKIRPQVVPDKRRAVADMQGRIDMEHYVMEAKKFDNFFPQGSSVVERPVHSREVGSSNLSPATNQLFYYLTPADYDLLERLNLLPENAIRTMPLDIKGAEHV